MGTALWPEDGFHSSSNNKETAVKNLITVLKCNPKMFFKLVAQWLQSGLSQLMFCRN